MFDNLGHLVCVLWYLAVTTEEKPGDAESQQGEDGDATEANEEQTERTEGDDVVDDAR